MRKPFESWDDVERETFFEIPQAVWDAIVEGEECEQQQKTE